MGGGRKFFQKTTKKSISKTSRNEVGGQNGGRLTTKAVMHDNWWSLNREHKTKGNYVYIKTDKWSSICQNVSHKCETLVELMQ